jgi:hypothetical protein
MRKIKSYTVNIVWSDGVEEIIRPSTQIREVIEDFLDGLEDEENLNTTTEKEECI